MSLWKYHLMAVFSAVVWGASFIVVGSILIIGGLWWTNRRKCNRYDMLHNARHFL